MLVLAAPVGRGPRSHCLLRIPERLSRARRGRGPGMPPAAAAASANGQAVGVGQNPRWRGQPNQGDPWGWGHPSPLCHRKVGALLCSASPPSIHTPTRPSPTHTHPHPPSQSPPPQGLQRASHFRPYLQGNAPSAPVLHLY